MKLAFFSSIVPDGSPLSGFEIANNTIVDGLRAMGHDVTIIGLQLPRQGLLNDPKTHVLAQLDVENSNASIAQKIKWVLQAYRHHLPLSAAKLKQIAATKVQEALQDCGPFDAHIINSYQMAAAFPAIMAPESTTTRVLYVAHNVEYRSAFENARSAKGGLQRYLYNRDGQLLKNIEEQLCHDADYVWALSEDDLQTLCADKLKGDKKAAGHLPLVTPKVEGRNASVPIDFDLGLIGTWSWQPNLVGLQWFLQEVVPLLADDVTIGIAGSAPQELTSAHSGVQFLGRVDSANGFLDRCRVIPLVSRGGTGVQLKTIEAFQAGYCCVATASSLRGVSWLPDNCSKADNAKSFAAALSEKIDFYRENKPVTVSGASFYQQQWDNLIKSLNQGLTN